MKLIHGITCALLAVGTAGYLIGQASPPAEASTTVAGKKINIKYSSPSVRGRQIFGANGLVSGDATYPVWRAGANEATAFHTDADLTFGDLAVPKGDYTLYVLVDPTPWKLIISKQTGQHGTEYNQSKDLGRVTMTMSKPATPIEKYKIDLTPTGGNNGKLTLSWEHVVASVNFKAK